MIIGEIHIDIGHGDTFRIEETFEKEVVLDRVEVGDTGQVGDEGAGGRTTTRTDHDPVVFRPVDEVLDDQEVRRKAGLADDVEFVVETGELFFRRRGITEALLESRFAELA